MEFRPLTEREKSETMLELLEEEKKILEYEINLLKQELEIRNGQDAIYEIWSSSDERKR